MSTRFLALPLAWLLLLAPAAAETATIGVAAPLSGSSAGLGAQVVAGARQAAERRPGTAIVEADTECSGEGGARAANALVARKVEAVVGFLCTESLEAALPILSKAGIPAIDVGVRADRFTAKRAKTQALIWRIAPRSGAEADAAARLIVARWRDAPFGLVDDGTIYGRGLSDAVRTRVEAAGLRAATVDNYRPAEEKQFGLARRIAATGVTRLFIAGDRPDIAIIARDAAALPLELEIAGGEALLDEAGAGPALPKGVLAVAPQNRFDALRDRTKPADETTEGYFGPAFAAAEIAAAAIVESRKSGTGLPTILNRTAFATALGPVRFDANGDGDLDLFRVFRFDGRDFAPDVGG